MADHVRQGVNSAMTKNLAKIKGFSEIKVEKVKEAARKCSVSTCLVQRLNGTDAPEARWQEIQDVRRAPTRTQVMLPPLDWQ